MKTQALFVMIFLGFAIIAKGQSPRGELFWVVESDRNSPDVSIVRIYDVKDRLIHEVKLNTRLDIKKRRHRKALVRIVKEQYTRINDIANPYPAEPRVTTNLPL